MRATLRDNTPNKLAVDMVEFQKMMSLGRQSCDQIGEKAGAVIRIGKRKLYNVEKVKEYLNSISGGAINDGE